MSSSLPYYKTLIMEAIKTTPSPIWTKLKPRPDPKFGYPCARSSHGLSAYLLPTNEDNYGKNHHSHSHPHLFLYGGEHVARTPISGEGSSGWILADNEWKCIQTTNPVPPLRVAHSQAVHNDRDVYIFGGRQGIGMDEQPLNDLWKFDTTTESWDQIKPANAPPEARSFHQMVCLGDSLYVFGGCGASGRLADLHRFDIKETKWHECGTSHQLKGRGGASVIPLNHGTLLGVVAGFAGEETKDGHAYDLISQQWCREPLVLDGLRPRSVCVSGTLLLDDHTTTPVALVFGGEVDPSHLGHEGAGCFENDLVVLSGLDGSYITTVPAADKGWPEARGWSHGAVWGNSLYMFGGLTGDDANPKRLNDLWQATIDVQDDSSSNAA